MDSFPRLEAQAFRFEDQRGWVEVLYESDRTVLKRSLSRPGVFRGMHIQLEPSPQVKLIRVVSGRIIDFVATVVAEHPQIRHCMLAPEQGWVRIAADLAHGFYAIEETSFEYVCDGAYVPAAERSYSILDYLARECGIAQPILSDKDKAAEPLAVGGR